MNKFAIVIAALAVTSAFAAPDKGKCDIKEVDECSKDVIPFAARTTMGATPEEIAEDCAKATQGVKCLTEHVERGCAKSGLATGVFKLMIEGAEKESGLRCDPNHKKGQDYVKYIPCLNKVGEKLQRCEKRMTADVEATSKAPVNERIARSCCAFNKLDKCVRDVARKECSEDHAQYVAGIVNGVAEAAVETVCTKFTAETCKKFSPLKVSEQTKYETLLPPIVDVLNV